MLRLLTMVRFDDRKDLEIFSDPGLDNDKLVNDCISFAISSVIATNGALHAV